MADEQRLPHLFLFNTADTTPYEYPGGGGNSDTLPVRERQSHAQHLLGQLSQARSESETQKETLVARGLPTKAGVHLELASEPGFGLKLESLEDRRSGIQLVTVRESGEGESFQQLATVFVPDGALGVFERKVRQYAEKNTNKGKPRHQPLVARISDLRLATLKSFWTDEPALLPHSDEEIWWEVWLRSAGKADFEDFRTRAPNSGLRLGDESVTFANTRVFLAYGSLEQMATSVEIVDSIGELRRAKEPPTTFLEMRGSDQQAWIDELLERVEPPSPAAPAICIHDTGVNRSHPLLEPVLEEADLHAVEPSWRVNDHEGHGTAMAGLAQYGDLGEALSSSQLVPLQAWLESVKILPPPPKSNDPKLDGAITEQATYRVEVEKPNRRRTHLMAVTRLDGCDRGRPSSWSATVDKLAFGTEKEPQRLWILCSGNSDPEARSAHPEHLETEEIHDPGQAWNALTVGACTDRWAITEDDFAGWEPLAEPGDLSPSTTTSFTWKPAWPLKPDFVLEGGNSARSPSGSESTEPDSLSLLTTYYQPLVRRWTWIADTSAASALAARMASHLQSQYPDLWPESVRALLAHSARWSPKMLKRYGGNGPTRSWSKTEDWKRLLRHCGLGIASLERALYSAGNRLTLVAQESLHPYQKGSGNSLKYYEMHFHELPWPTEQLLELGELEVELRVTLSYFVEPNPSERGYEKRHQYASHGLRFDVCGAAEDPEDFKKRKTAALRAEDEESPKTGDTAQWTLGPNLRHRGSLHSDVWEGSAADLATRQHLAVSPVSGWGKERFKLGRWKQPVRYALVVSIEAPEIEVDLYTPVASQIGISIEI